MLDPTDYDPLIDQAVTEGDKELAAALVRRQAAAVAAEPAPTDTPKPAVDDSLAALMQRATEPSDETTDVEAAEHAARLEVGQAILGFGSAR